MTKPSSQFVLSPIKAIELAAAKIPGAISLAQGIPSFPTPQVVKDFVIEKLREGVVDKYSLTTGLLELREEISSSLSKSGLLYSPDSEIIVTAGSIEGISASILAHTEPGDEVLVPSPTYASYLGAIGVARCTPRFFELDEDNNFDFQIDRIARAITPRTKILLYCSPNNPTGTLFSEKNTRALLALAEKRNLLVLIDEVYKDFYYTDDKHFTPCLIPEARSRVIRVCSFSKAYAMTGWRVGFVHADKSLVQGIVKYHDAIVTCAPVISQYAAIAALRFCDDYLQEFRAEFRKRRDFTIQALDELSHVLDYQLPKATYFVFPRIKDLVPLARDSTRLAYDILDKVKLALVPGVAFGPSGEQHLRISYGREWGDLREGMSRLGDYFSKTLHARDATSRMRVVNQPQRASPMPPLRKVAQTVLGLAAKLWIWRNKPTIIGIAGIRGKTVLKRSIVGMLSRERNVRGSVLSYNTAFGLPLSVLNTELPRSSWGKIKLLPKILARALFERNAGQILVLEYGVESTADAKTLLRIAKPEWLVIAELGDSDPGVPSAGIREGVRELAANVTADKILWPAEDPWMKELSSTLLEKNKLSLEAICDSPPLLSANGDLGVTDRVPGRATERSVRGALGTYPFTRDIVGESAARGLVAGVLVAERLGLSPESIRRFLSDSERQPLETLFGPLRSEAKLPLNELLKPESEDWEDLP